MNSHEREDGYATDLSRRIGVNLNNLFESIRPKRSGSLVELNKSNQLEESLLGFLGSPVKENLRKRNISPFREEEDKNDNMSEGGGILKNTGRKYGSERREASSSREKDSPSFFGRIYYKIREELFEKTNEAVGSPLKDTKNFFGLG